METAIAVVGVACRFPDASDPRRFWGNLDDGTVSTRRLSAETLRAAGVSARTLAAPDFVGVAGTLPDPAGFAAEFFGYPPREAELIDPAQRLFLETCWEAMEAAGHPPGPPAPLTGVFAGAGPSNYSLALQVAAAREHGVAAVNDDADLYLGSAPDFLTSRAAYKLDLRGPSVSVGTACSSSLSAVHYAVLGLLSGECDLALAGGAAVNEPHAGYRYRPGGLASADGLCRAFDARSTGTSFSSGVGVVALRRLADALADGDPVRAVVLGSAVGNDGAERTGFTAPSPGGLAAVVRAALGVAGVSGTELRYVEAHGSGTPLGDQIELRGLTDGLSATGTGFCGLGSVKANIGHCGPAAGIAGFIKAVHVAATGSLPPHPLFAHARDPGVLAGSPFAISPEPGRCADPDRRVLVNSMGLGGTIATAVLAPPPAPTRPPATAGGRVRLLLSARTRGELDAMSRALADELVRDEHSLADVAHTLRVGRASFDERRVVTATPDQVVAALRLPRPPLVRTAHVTPTGTFRGDTEEAAVEAWLGGADVDWAALPGTGRRVTLPTYPFSRRRYWALDRLDPVAAPAAAPVLRSTSDTGTADDLEADLLSVWRELFGVAAIGPDDEFGALGGTSLLSVRMALEIQRRHDVLVNVHRAGGSRATVRRVAELVRGGRGAGAAADGDGALVDADIELPLGPVASAPSTAGQDVLLTGATGFLGAFLLHALLRVPARRVHCLVRADGEAHARQRIRAAAARYELPEPDSARVVPVTDLERVDAAAVGYVLHCAARVVFTEPYRVLRADNVHTLVDLVRWMRGAGIRDLGFVSSIGATGESLGGAYRITETRQQPLDPLQGGYGVSKWVGERILERAERDGLRVRVFRPGFILGATATGACNPRDLIWHLMASGLEVGAHPEDDRAWPMAPVDVVAAAIAELTTDPTSAGRAYHLAAETAVSPRRMFELLAGTGLATAPVALERWQRLVAERALVTGHQVLSTMALYEVDDHWLGPHDLEAVAWRPWLAGHGLDPNPSGELLRRCLDHLAAREADFARLLSQPLEVR
ncbi:beta-ketoacyl synthase N-terminal-like domain-containing protein [Actinophytocola sp.]|uniref:beta-ketoacyl synthase N-terminal-like domain-containing protein n=1 Tax=Actinophytocola sp. TaxID=1872138 RepID=UPI003D6A2A87